MVTAFSLVIRFAWAGWATVTPISDFGEYSMMAWRFLKDGVLRTPLGYAYRTPGYPFLLSAIYAVFGQSPRIAGLGNALIGGVTSGLIVLLAARTLSRRAGVVAGLLHAVSLTAIIYTPVLASENLGVFLLVASLLALSVSHGPPTRPWMGALAGFLFTATVLTRPAFGTLMAPAFAVLAVYCPHRRAWSLRTAAAFFIAAAVTFAPWSIRNHRLGISPLTISTQSGPALWWDIHPYVSPGAPFAYPPGVWEMPEEQRSRACTEKAREWIRAHPKLYLQMCGARLARIFGSKSDSFAAAYMWPSKQNDNAMLAVYKARFQADDATPALARDGRSAVQWRQYHVFRNYGIVLGPLMLAAVVLSLPRWRAFSFALLPAASYLSLLVATVFIERYREASNALLFIPMGAMLADIFLGTHDLGRWPGRTGKFLVAAAFVVASIYAHRTGLADELCLPPSPSAPNPDAGHLEFTAVDLSQPAESYLVPWLARNKAVAVSREPQGLQIRVAAPAKDKSYGAIRFRAYAPQAIELDLTFINPADIDRVFVDACDETGKMVHRWAWENSSRKPDDGNRRTYVFLPARQTGHFVPSGSAKLDNVRTIQIAASVRPGGHAGFVLHGARVAAAALAQPDIRGHQFTPVSLGSGKDQSSWWNQRLDSVITECFGGRCEVNAQATQGNDRGHYAGLRFAVPPADAYRLRLRFSEPENIESVFVDTYTADRKLCSRWTWTCQAFNRPADKETSYVFVPGQDVGFFRATSPDPANQAVELHVFLRIAPGRSAGMVVASVETATRCTSQPATRTATSPATAPASQSARRP